MYNNDLDILKSVADSYRQMQLDEISKKTLGSYVKKAGNDLTARKDKDENDDLDGKFEVDRQDAMGNYISPEGRDKKIGKREQGIKKAKGKLNKSS